MTRSHETGVPLHYGSSSHVARETKGSYSGSITKEIKPSLSKGELYRQQQLVKLNAAKMKAKEEDKEEFDVEIYARTRYDSNPKMWSYLRDPRMVEKLEMRYYLRYPEIKTIMEFVNKEISESDYV